jgi:3-oxoacyl-[acyl-carrier-protein] synthase-3
MIGIKDIAHYIPEGRVNNYDRKEEFQIDDNFIENKIGFQSVARKAKDETTFSMCMKAFDNLIKKGNVKKEEIEIVILVTQTPEFNIPHTSAIIHNKLELQPACMCFDVSQGCAGYIHGLSVIQAVMEQNGFKKGLLFTCDPYSDIMNHSDRNTTLLFGDGAAVTLLTDDPVYEIGKYTFGTLPNSNEALTCVDGVVNMYGRQVFSFAVREVPKDFELVLSRNNLKKEDIDQFLLHQGSLYIINALRDKLGLTAEQAPFDAANYGNVVSSSIPVILEKSLGNEDHKKLLLSGFGVGLSWGSTILRRI